MLRATNLTGGAAALSVGAALALGLTACGGSTGPSGTADVSVAFQTQAMAVPFSVAGSSAGPDGASSEGARAIQVAGTNGILTLESVHLILAEFQLERDDGCDSSGSGNPCHDFEAPPQLLALPAETGASVVAVTREVPAGTYTELEFEVEELDDEDDPEEQQQIEQLRQQIRSQFPRWPLKGSLRVAGSFAPAGGGDARPYEAFFEAEIEIEREFAQPMVISDDGPDMTVTVTVDPDVWFRRGDGTVRDLSVAEFNCRGQETCPVSEFEVEIENGFTEVEFEADG